jgi:hypothetical protein
LVIFEPFGTTRCQPEYQTPPAATIFASTPLVLPMPAKLHGKSANGSYEKQPRSLQILRRHSIIFGEFVASLTFTHIGALR